MLFLTPVFSFFPTPKQMVTLPENHTQNLTTPLHSIVPSNQTEPIRT